MARSQRHQKLPVTFYNPAPPEQLMWAVYTGDVAAVIRLLPLVNNQGRDYLDAQQNTLLIRAAMGNRGEVFDILLSEGHDPALANIHGNTCLHFFCRYANEASIDVLHTRGVFLSPRNYRHGETPLRWCKTSHLAAARTSTRALMERLGAIDFPDKPED